MRLPRGRVPRGSRQRVKLRTRLTLAYGGLLAGAGLAVVCLLYVFMNYGPTYNLNAQPTDGVKTTAPHSTGAEQAGKPTSPSVSCLHGSARPDPKGAGAVGTGAPDEPMVCAPTDPAGDAFDWFDISSKSDFLKALLLYGALAMLILVLVAVFLGWLLAGRMLAPLQRITDTASGIAGSTLHERVALSGPKDEIRELADTFDGMLQRLDRSFQAQRRFAANASHELRTPLASMRTILQVAQIAPEAYPTDDLIRKLLDLNGRSTEITEALLSLARADHGQIAVEEVELGPLSEEVCVHTADLAHQANVALTTSIAGSGRLRGDRVLLRQLVRNLVDNSVRHNHPGGTAAVEVDEPDQHRVRLVVRNTGLKLSHDEAERVLEPFHRLDTRRAGHPDRPAGHGLGLALAESIVRAHSGTLRAEPLATGGLKVTVLLPADGPPPEVRGRVAESIEEHQAQ